ncbi:hypothetical protein [Streptomyces sp. NPDC051994]|uniref:hypothetical protein n=1 Tax=unclassified Streptomyces TaxID=2593676 RepID=UPI0034261175
MLHVVEDFTPRYQARPQHWAVDLDLTGALRYLDRTPKEKRPARNFPARAPRNVQLYGPDG